MSVFAGLFVRGTTLGAVYLVWAISGVLALVPATEELIARVVLRARPPTENERAVLEPLWQDVSSTADVDEGKYRLWVEDRDGLNASASAGHIVIVTRRAIDAMPAHQLSAVLAHELGHHIGGHSWSQFLTYWYSLPARLFTSFALWLVPWLIRGVLALVAFTRRLSLSFLARRLFIVGLVLFLVRVAIWLLIGFIVLSAIGAVVAAVSTPIGAVVVVGAVALVILPSWLARQGELRADRFAAEIGYGDALVETLEDWLSMGVQATRHSLRARLFSTHPELSVRIDRLNTYLRGAGR